MADALSLIESLHRAAEDAGLKYLIIGGFAASYWGTPRFTGDVDIALSNRDLDAVTAIASSIGYARVFLHPRGAFAHFASDSPSKLRLDVMFVDDDTWAKLQESAAVVDIGGQSKYPMVSALHLIAMKLHAAKQPDRSDIVKDLNDIAQILVRQGITWEELEQRDILEKHGTEKTLRILRELLVRPNN